MSETPEIPKKSQALIAVRKEVRRCPKCGEPFDSVEANSHRIGGDPGKTRFYFQFLHGSRECIDFTTAGQFAGWLEKARTDPS